MYCEYDSWPLRKDSFVIFSFLQLIAALTIGLVLAETKTELNTGATINTKAYFWGKRVAHEEAIAEREAEHERDSGYPYYLAKRSTDDVQEAERSLLYYPSYSYGGYGYGAPI